MKKSASVLLILGAVILGTACNSPRPVVGNDTGTIVLPDGGARDTGGGGGPDTGGARDTGGGGGSCTLDIEPGNFGTMSAGCLPRCAASTATTINACPAGDGGACLNAALEDDTTAGTPIDINGEAGNTLTCGLCFQFGQLHCFSDPCPSEVDGLVAACLGGTDMAACTAATNAVNACLMGLSDTAPVQACLNSMAGPAGCF